jgi:hypothetical protein
MSCRNRAMQENSVTVSILRRKEFNEGRRFARPAPSLFPQDLNNSQVNLLKLQ